MGSLNILSLCDEECFEEFFSCLLGMEADGVPRNFLGCKVVLDIQDIVFRLAQPGGYGGFQDRS